MKKVILIILVLFTQKGTSQNKQLLYNFADLPQTQLLNPAIDINNNFFVGIPLLSGISTEISSSKFILSSIFAEDGENINNKVLTSLNGLDSKAFVSLNTQIEVLNVGFRVNNNIYLSFGFYEEIDAIGFFPKDIFTFLTAGNATSINRSFNASQVNYKLDILGVLHFGISRKVNNNLSLGTRFKLYSSALNLESKNNTGTFTTVEGRNNLLTHYFNNINVTAKSSGLVDESTNQYIDDFGTYFGNTFFGANMGIGLDFGFSYNVSSQLEFSASILDFGFIRHKKNVKNTKVEGSFTFEGLDFLSESNDNNSWQEIDRRFKRDLPTTENLEAYTSLRPTKINAALKYKFGERRSKICYDDSYKDFFTDAIGLQLFSVVRPLGPQLALTGFYEKSLTKKIHTKFTYTIDDFSTTNLGAGLSAQIGKFNIYTMLDNILSYKNLSSSNRVSLQLGFNLIFN